MSEHVVVYKDRGGQYRWRHVADNGQVVATSGEAFASRWNARRAARQQFPEATIEVVVLDPALPPQDEPGDDPVGPGD